MPFDAGSIYAKMELDGGQFVATLRTVTNHVRSETEKQQRIMNSIQMKDSFDKGSLSSMRNFYAAQAAEAMKLRTASQANAVRESRGQATDPLERQILARTIRVRKATAIYERAAEAARTRMDGTGGNPVVPTGGGDGGAGGGKHDWLSELNGEAGKRSMAGKLMKLAMGGGAIGAIGMMTKEANALATAFETAMLKLDRGETSAGAVTAELIKQIPIVGALGDAIQKTWNISATLAADRVNRISEAMKSSAEMMIEAIKMMNGADRSKEAFAREAQRRIELRNAPEGTKRDLIEARQGKDRAIEAQNDALTNNKESGPLAALKKASDDLQTKLQPELDAAQKRFDAVKPVYWDGLLVERDPEQIKQADVEKENLDRINSSILQAKQAYDSALVKEEEATQANILQIQKDAADQRKQIGMKMYLDKGLNWVKGLGLLNNPIGKKQQEDDKNKAKLRENANKSITDLQQQASEAGMSETDKKLAQMKRENPLLSDQQIEKARQALTSIDLVTQAKAMKEALMTPAEKYAKAISDLDAMRKSTDGNGNPLLSDQQYAAGVEKAQRERDGDTKGGGLAGFIRGGSADAAKYQYELAGMGKIKDELPKAQFKETQRQTELLAGIKGNLKQPPVFDLAGMA